MDRATILKHLEGAHQHVAEGATNVAQQREVIAELEHDGRDAKLARELLRVLEDRLAAHIAVRNRLEGNLRTVTVGKGS